MRLRHVGHAMNILWGPLTLFSTHNYADTYSPLLRLLCEGHGEMPQQEEPTMPTLQEMHRMTAASPASTADFWLLREQLEYRHFYGMDDMHIGKYYLETIDNKHVREDNLASSGTAGLAGFGESSLCPGEAQQRGFEHGHDRSSIPKGHQVNTKTSKVCVCSLDNTQQLRNKPTLLSAANHHPQGTARYRPLSIIRQEQALPATCHRPRTKKHRC